MTKFDIGRKVSCSFLEFALIDTAKEFKWKADAKNLLIE